MRFVSTASALNLRQDPRASSDVPILGELRQGDLFESNGKEKHGDPWVLGTVLSGVAAGLSGYVRRKWLAQHFETPPLWGPLDPTAAAHIIRTRTKEFDAVVYHLPLTGPKKAATWAELSKSGWIDCSGWVYLLAREVLGAYGRKSKPGALSTHSDSQTTAVGARTGLTVSWNWLQKPLLRPGVLLGIDFKEYSWDRNRALDIDHIVMIGGNEDGSMFVSQSSSSGGGVIEPASKC